MRRPVSRSSRTFTFRPPTLRSDRCCLSTRGPAAGRPPRSGSRPKPPPAGSGPSSCAAATISSNSSATPSPRVPTGSRRPAGTAPRPSWRRRPPNTAFLMPAFRPAPATTSRSIWAWTATTSWGLSTPSSTAANTSSISERSTAGCSSTTFRWACTPRRCRARATGTRRSALCSTPHQRPWVREDPNSICAGPPPMGSPTPRRPRSWCPTTPTGSAVQSARGPARELIAGSSVSPSCGPAARTARQGPHRRYCDSGRHLYFQVDSAHPVPLGIDGEAVVLEPPIRFRIRPGVLRVRIAPQHPGASPSAMQPDHARDGLRVLATIAAGRAPTTDALRRRDVQADI